MNCERHALIGGWVGPIDGLVISVNREFFVNGVKVCGRVWVEPSTFLTLTPSERYCSAPP